MSVVLTRRTDEASDLVLYSTFSRNVWRLYAGAKGLVVCYYNEASDLVDDVSMMFDNHNMQLEEVFSHGLSLTVRG
jgi:hypothetical protein